MTPLELILGAGAVTRLAVLVAWDDWPFRGCRWWTAARWPWAHRLINCPGCVSVWLGAGWWLAWAALPSAVWQASSAALTSSMTAWLLAVAYHSRETDDPRGE